MCSVTLSVFDYSCHCSQLPQFHKTNFFILAISTVEQNLVQATNECLELVELLKLKRANPDGECFRILFDQEAKLANDFRVQIKAPRIIDRQQNRASVSSNDVMEHCKLNLHHTFLDHLISQLQDRLCISTNRLGAEMLLARQLVNLTDEVAAHIGAGYAELISSSYFTFVYN